MLGVIIAGGSMPSPRLAGDLAGADLIVAADAGVGVARSLELVPTAVVGDLDPADPADLEWARRKGAVIEAHDRRKEHTDLELALARVASVDRDALVVLGTIGDRVDHERGNWAALAGAGLPVIEVRYDAGSTWVVTDEIELTEPPGTTVSLQAWGGPAVVTAAGFAWELDHEELSPFEARGISNEVVSSPATIRVHSGVAFVTRPVQGR